MNLDGCVKNPNPMPFLLFFIFHFCFHVLCINNLREQRLRAALARVKKEPHPLFKPTGAREKAINPSLSGTRPTAHQPRKRRNQTPTKGAE